MQNPVRLWAAFRGQSKDLYPINRFLRRRKRLAPNHRDATHCYHSIFLKIAPLGTLLALYESFFLQKATIFEARFRDGYPEPRFTFWCLEWGARGRSLRRPTGEALWNPSSRRHPKGLRPRASRRAPRRPRICTAQSPERGTSPIHGRVLRRTTISSRGRPHINISK